MPTLIESNREAIKRKKSLEAYFDRILADEKKKKKADESELIFWKRIHNMFNGLPETDSLFNDKNTGMHTPLTHRKGVLLYKIKQIILKLGQEEKLRRDIEGMEKQVEEVFQPPKPWWKFW